MVELDEECAVQEKDLAEAYSGMENESVMIPSRDRRVRLYLRSSEITDI